MDIRGKSHLGTRIPSAHGEREALFSQPIFITSGRPSQRELRQRAGIRSQISRYALHFSPNDPKGPGAINPANRIVAHISLDPSQFHSCFKSPLPSCLSSTTPPHSQLHSNYPIPTISFTEGVGVIAKWHVILRGTLPRWASSFPGGMR